MSITFDGVELKNASVFDDDLDVLTKVTTLLSGKRSVQASSEVGFTPKFRCYTTTYSDVTSLAAKVGSSGSLVIDSDTYTNCYISSFMRSEIAPGKWTYEVGFVRDTT